MYLLDTDIVIWILRANPILVAFLKKAAERSDVGISTVTIAEVYQHVLPSELSVTEDFFDRHSVLTVTREIAREAGRYWQQYSPKLAKLSLIDCIIAATAKLHRCTLYTLNIRHFPMVDLEIGKPPRVNV